MPRLFTGIEVPAETAQWLAALRGGLVGARWIDPEDYHVTLRFIGDIDVRTASEIAEHLDEVHRPPASIEFEGLTWFGGDKPRAIVARIKPNRATDGSAGRRWSAAFGGSAWRRRRAISPPCHAGEIALDFADGCRRLSERARGRAGDRPSRRRVLCSIRREIRSAAAPMSWKPSILWLEGSRMPLQIDAARRRVRLDPRNPRVLPGSLSRLSRDRAHARRSFSGSITASGASAATPTFRRCCATGGSAGRSCMWRAERASAGPSRPTHLEPFGAIERHSLLELEPPAHTRLRALVNRAFVSRQVERLAPAIGAIWRNG